VKYDICQSLYGAIAVTSFASGVRQTLMKEAIKRRSQEGGENDYRFS